MKRRIFLQLPVAGAALSAVLPLAIRPVTAAAGNLPKKSVLVRAGADRTDQPFQFLDATFTVKVSGADNEGRCVIFDTLRHAKVGPQLHVHEKLDEWFYVMDGEFKFQTDGETMRLKPGDSLFVPRNVVHAFVKTSEGPARLVVMHQPAGTMEEFFRTASQLADKSVEGRRALAIRHDTRFVGPALTPD